MATALSTQHSHLLLAPASSKTARCVGALRSTLPARRFSPSFKALSLSERRRFGDVYRTFQKKGTTRFGGIRCQASSDGRITQQEFTEMAWQGIVSSPEVAKESKYRVHS